MIAILKNNASYSVELNKYQSSEKIKILPKSVFEIKTSSHIELSYYLSLSSPRITVTISHESQTDSDQSTEEVQEAKDFSVVKLEDLTDDELKRIIKSLGISTNCRARWKLESLIQSHVSDLSSLNEYLRS